VIPPAIPHATDVSNIKRTPRSLSAVPEEAPVAKQRQPSVLIPEVDDERSVPITTPVVSGKKLRPLASPRKSVKEMLPYLLNSNTEPKAATIIPLYEKLSSNNTADDVSINNEQWDTGSFYDPTPPQAPPVTTSSVTDASSVLDGAANLPVKAKGRLIPLRPTRVKKRIKSSSSVISDS